MIRVRAPNGTIVQFPDGTAPGQINQVMGQYHAQSSAAADARQLVGHGTNDAGPFMSFMNGRTMNFAPEAMGAAGAFNTAVDNLGRTLTGRPKPYGAADMYHAASTEARNEGQAYAAAHPVANTVLGVTGAAALPLNAMAGRFVAGAKSLLPAIARSVAVGTPLAAAYGAGAAGPDNRMGGALQGVAVGGPISALLPVGGAFMGKTANMVGGVARNAQRSLGTARPEDVAVRRLSSALAKDVRAGVDPNANFQAWKAASSPTLADLSGENVRAAVRDAGTQGPARTALANYQRQVASDLQDNALKLTNGLTPADQRSAPAVAASLDQTISQATTPPIQAQPGQGGAQLSQALNERAAQAKQAVDDAYSAARAANPEQAHLAKGALPGFAANVRGAISDFSPKDIPRVTGNLADLDTLNAPTARDLFEIRSRLSNLRAANDPVEAKAAGQAVRALDGQIDGAMQGGQITGDPKVVGLWRNANAMRRAYGQQFEGGDLIHDLTSLDYRGGARSLAVAPEDASNYILGRNGVSPKPNLARDFGRVQDLLGADHPAVRAVQHEAASRLLSSGAGTPEFGTAFGNFQRSNPTLAGALLPDLSDSLASSRAAVTQALGARQGLTAGGSVLNAAPDSYNGLFGSTAPNSPTAQVGARQALADAIGSPREGAVGALNRISTATNPGRNLATTFGDDAANNYRTGLGQEVDRMDNANWMAPQLGSKSFSSARDAGHGISHNPIALLAGMVKRVVGGAPLNDAERAAMVNPAINQMSPELLTALLRQNRPGMFGSGYLSAPAASVSTAPLGQ